MLSHMLKVASVVLVMSFASATQAPGALVVLEDSFTAANGTALSGRAPDVVNEPGSTWIPMGAGTADIQGNRARIGADIAAVLDISSSGSYTKPTQFRISADLELGGLINATDTFPVRGLTLGFYDNTTGDQRNPTGLTYHPNGELRLVEDGTVADTLTGLSTSGVHSLAYSIDTTTGGISDVTWDGSPVSFGVTTTAFDDGETDIAGFTGSGTSQTQQGFVDNFTITDLTRSANAIPEPATLLGVTFGGLALLRRRR